MLFLFIQSKIIFATIAHEPKNYNISHQKHILIFFVTNLEQRQKKYLKM